MANENAISLTTSMAHDFNKRASDSLRWRRHAAEKTFPWHRKERFLRLHDGTL